MAFVLRVVSGADEGSEYPCDGEAKLGRTADNDVVIKDASASRSHARVFEKGGKYFLEDLGSANGTRVNDTAVRPKSPKEVKPGDTITIGEWGITVDPGDGGGDDEAAGGDDESPDATMERPPARAIERSPRGRPPARAAPPSATGADEDDAPPDDGGDDGGGDDAPEEAPRGRALARGGASAPAPRARGGAAPVVAEEKMSAADRARQRRELNKSTSGKAQLAWQDMSKPVRYVVGFFLTAIALGIVGTGVYLVMPKNVKPKLPEPLSLAANGNPISESFGLGDGVYFKKPDMKSFTININSPTQVVGVLHYQSKGVSKDEVTISLNGSELGQIPPDNIDPESREIELVLPSSLFKAREENTLIFDNTLNPPGSEEWMVWNVWLEVIPVPEMSPEQAEARAKDELGKAQKFYDLKDVGAESLFKSWKTYREAWLLLEATPNRPESLLQISRTRMKEIRPELDHRCSAMLVEFKKLMNQRPQNLFKCRGLLDDITRYFPTREHPCYLFVKDLRKELDDLSEQEFQQPPPGGTPDQH